ncbi:MAG: hypothetical protein JNM07_01115 [Phycisphaerae bacterium]|nr:hypothetical protein [Phycisphaerae bacterium]
MSTPNSRTSRLALAISSLVALGPAVGCGVLQPVDDHVTRTDAAPDARTADRRADIEALHDGLIERHADPFVRISRAEFQALADALRAEAETIDDLKMLLGLRRLAASIGDGHTQVVLETGKPPCETRIPVQFVALADGVFITAAPNAFADALGARVVGVGSMTMAEASERIRAIAASETETAARDTTARFLKYDQVLYGAGIIPAVGAVTLRVEGGPDAADPRPREITIESVGPSVGVPGKFAPDPARITLPLGRQSRPEWCWHQTLPEDAILYCRYDRCADAPGKTVAAWSEEVSRELASTGVRKVAVDLRHNAGGNSGLLHPLIAALRGWVEAAPTSRRVYALIGPATFSSGITNALDLQRFADAVLVGETPGQPIGSFGEVRSFTLPRSGLTVMYGSVVRDDPRNPIPIRPAIVAEMRAADYFAGRDPVMEAVRTDARP